MLREQSGYLGCPGATVASTLHRWRLGEGIAPRPEAPPVLGCRSGGSRTIPDGGPARSGRVAVLGRRLALALVICAITVRGGSVLLRFRRSERFRSICRLPLPRAVSGLPQRVLSTYVEGMGRAKSARSRVPRDSRHGSEATHLVADPATGLVLPALVTESLVATPARSPGRDAVDQAAAVADALGALAAAEVARVDATARRDAALAAARRAGHSWTELARVLGVTPQAVQQRVARSKGSETK